MHISVQRHNGVRYVVGSCGGIHLAMRKFDSEKYFKFPRLKECYKRFTGLKQGYRDSIKFALCMPLVALIQYYRAHMSIPEIVITDVCMVGLFAFLQICGAWIAKTILSKCKKISPAVQLGCIGLLLAGISALAAAQWSRDNLTAFDADGMEREVAAFLTECTRDGEQTFVGEQAEDIACRVVLLAEDAALVEVTAKQNGVAVVSRRALHRQTLTGKYQLAYRPTIEDREMYMEDGTEYTGSTFARHYRYTVASDTNTIVARDHSWTGRTIQLACLWGLCIGIWLLYRRRQQE